MSGDFGALNRHLWRSVWLSRIVGIRNLAAQDLFPFLGGDSCLVTCGQVYPIKHKYRFQWSQSQCSPSWIIHLNLPSEDEVAFSGQPKMVGSERWGLFHVGDHQHNALALVRYQ